MGYREAQYRATVTHEDGDEAHEISVVFDGYVGGDMVPYGSTWVEAPGGGPEEIHSITVGDEELTESEFEQRFGKEIADALLERAYDNAEVYE